MVGRSLGGVLLVLLTVACGKEAEPPVPASGVRVTASGVVISTEPAWLADLRRRHHEAQREAFENLMQHPGAITEYDRRSVAIVQARREEAIEALSKVRDDEERGGGERVQAILALELLGVPPDPRQAARIAAADPGAVHVVLGGHDRLVPPGQPRPAAFDQLVLEAIGHPNRWTTHRATTLAIEWGLPGTRAALERHLASVEDPSDHLLASAFRLDPSLQTLAPLLARLAEDRGVSTYAQGSALDALCEVLPEIAEEGLRETALRDVLAHLVATPPAPSFRLSELDALDLLGASSEGAAKLEEIVRRAASPAVRERALMGLCKRDRERALALAEEAGLPRPCSEEAEEGRAATTQEAAALLLRHGVLTEAEVERASEKLRDEGSPDPHEEKTGLFPRVMDLLGASARTVAYDMETGTFPNRHDELIDEYALGSAGRFRPEAALETVVPPEDEDDFDGYAYTVEFIHDGRLYRFQPRNDGDWYDVDAVMAAIEQALEDAGIRERFLMLDGGGQFVAFVFAEPGAWKALADEVGIEMASSAEKALEDSRAFEQQVLEDIERGGR